MLISDNDISFSLSPRTLKKLFFLRFSASELLPSLHSAEGDRE
jgi:hypothetical protein